MLQQFNTGITQHLNSNVTLNLYGQRKNEGISQEESKRKSELLERTQKQESRKEVLSEKQKETISLSARVEKETPREKICLEGQKNTLFREQRKDIEARKDMENKEQREKIKMGERISRKAHSKREISFKNICEHPTQKRDILESKGNMRSLSIKQSRATTPQEIHEQVRRCDSNMQKVSQ